MKKIFLVLAWAVYLPTMFFAILSLVAGSAYWTGINFPPDAIVAGLRFTLYATLLMTIPIVIRWWFKNLTWGTFVAYSWLLSIGFAMQAIYQELLGDDMMRDIMWAMCAVVVPLLGYFIYRNFIHVKALIAEAK